MPVVDVIIPRRNKKYWDSLDHYSRHKMLRAVMQEFNKHDKEAFHYISSDIHPDHPPSTYWIVKPYFQNCQVFLLHGSFHLLNDENMIAETGRAYRLKREDRIGLCGSTTVVVVGGGGPGGGTSS